jgi:hypothetical protein
MDAEWDDKVRARAYAIWEREGRPEGGAERHWAQAAEELKAEERGRMEEPGDVKLSAYEAASTAAETHEAAGAGPRPKGKDAGAGHAATKRG